MTSWTVELLDAVVRRELDALPADQIARFLRIGDLIQALGLERVGEPHVKHLEGALWEIRLKGRDGISRALYVIAKPRRVVVVCVFVKKSNKTPRREIELAFKRAEFVK
ncbi:MAG: type II toxin-antitoxin system RelE/ParE family toxin [Beijerinckiaceae bacterium]|nr:type II toxin-antitoxin system RelE/ParE family toxin [Beijerinckiaceae bacterium]